jgi:hypothetical protein
MALGVRYTDSSFGRAKVKMVPQNLSPEIAPLDDNLTTPSLSHFASLNELGCFSLWLS